MTGRNARTPGDETKDCQQSDFDTGIARSQESFLLFAVVLRVNPFPVDQYEGSGCRCPCPEEPTINTPAPVLALAPAPAGDGQLNHADVAVAAKFTKTQPRRRPPPPRQQLQLRHQPLQNLRDDRALAVANEEEAVEPLVCPDGWISYQDSCYYVESSKMSLGQAEKACNEKGATLFVADSIEGICELLNEVMKETPPYFWSWIGLGQCATDSFPRWQVAWTGRLEMADPSIFFCTKRMVLDC
ncbi:hypothetical protein COOONC_04756 [Cooperia oncophora]